MHLYAMPLHVVIREAFLTLTALEGSALEVHGSHMSVFILFLCENLITLITMQFHFIRELDKEIVMVEDERLVRNTLHASHRATPYPISIDINESIIRIGWEGSENLITIITAQMPCMVVFVVVTEEL